MTIERAIRAGCEASFTAVNPSKEFDGCDYPDCNCSGIGTAQAIIAALGEPTEAEIEAMVRGACASLGYDPGQNWHNVTTAADLDDIMRAAHRALFAAWGVKP